MDRGLWAVAFFRTGATLELAVRGRRKNQPYNLVALQAKTFLPVRISQT